MAKRIVFFIILGILIFAVYGGIDLSLTDFRQKDVCPKILGIPACYLVLLFFSLTLAAHVLPFTRKDLFYIIFLTFPFLLAVSGTLSELTGTVVCPRTPGGTPMCFISAAICSALLILKVVERKIT